MIELFDSHFHIINYRFPLVANAGYLPEEFTVSQYRRRMCQWRSLGGVVVSGSFQAFDQDYLLAALQELGSRFVGVTQLPASANDEEIINLAQAGVRGLRFNLRRGGSETVGCLQDLANRVHDLVGWHVELYIDARDLLDLVDVVSRLPAVAVDHLGLFKHGLPTLLKLVERGLRVKASGFGRLDFDPGTAIHALVAANPEALMFGSDLPSTRAPRPFRDEDVTLICDALDGVAAARVLYRNALKFYRLSFDGH
jgi:predicted TIM-barrel fold metal-dependent hydrolase